MGNRAVVTFTEPYNDDAISVYLHWEGGAGSVSGFLHACRKHYCYHSASYAAAYFCAAAALLFGDGLSVGVTRRGECGDNGVYIVGPRWRELGGKTRKSKLNAYDLRSRRRVFSQVSAAIAAAAKARNDARAAPAA